MKKLYCTFLIGCMTLSSVLAQDDFKKGFYIKPSGSYFFKVAPVEFPAIGGQPARDRDFTLYQATGQQTVQRERTLTGSFGEGFRASLLGGYRFSRYIGLEVGFNYFSGAEQEMTHQNGTRVLANGTPIPGAFSLHTAGKVRAFDVAPAIVLHIPTSGSVKPYTKVGVIIPVGGYSETTTEISDMTGQIARSQGLLPPGLPPDAIMSLSNVVRVDRTYSNPTVGFQSAVGVDIWLSESVSLFAEVEYRNVTVGSKRRELQSLEGAFSISSASAGGEVASGQLSADAVSESSRRINFHKEIQADRHNVIASGEFDRDRPSDEVQNRISFGGLGVSIGLKIPLSGGY